MRKIFIAIIFMVLFSTVALAITSNFDSFTKTVTGTEVLISPIMNGIQGPHFIALPKGQCAVTIKTGLQTDYISVSEAKDAWSFRNKQTCGYSPCTVSVNLNSEYFMMQIDNIREVNYLAVSYSCKVLSGQ